MFELPDMKTTVYDLPFPTWFPPDNSRVFSWYQFTFSFGG